MVLTAPGRYLTLMRSGRKTSTIRVWAECRVASGEAVTFTNYRESVRTRCMGVDRRAVRELTDRDARADGFDSLSELLAALTHHYPTLEPTTRVWVVRFALVD